MTHVYKKMDENYKVVECPRNDVYGKITGKILLNLPAYFDENPDVRIALGWTKVLQYEMEELKYDPQTEYCISGTRRIDDYTVEEYPIVLKKTEEQLAAEETGAGTYWNATQLWALHF